MLPGNTRPRWPVWVEPTTTSEACGRDRELVQALRGRGGEGADRDLSRLDALELAAHRVGGVERGVAQRGVAVRAAVGEGAGHDDLRAGGGGDAAAEGDRVLGALRAVDADQDRVHGLDRMAARGARVHRDERRRVICGFPAACDRGPPGRREAGAGPSLSGMPTNVLIAGGGPAGMEAALALHRLAGDRVATTVLAPEAEFTYRPLSVLAPFAEGGALTYPLARFAADAGLHPRPRPARLGRHRRARGPHRHRRAAAVRRAADRVRRAAGGAVRRRRRLHRLADRPGAPARHRPGRRGRLPALARVRRPARARPGRCRSTSSR